MAIGDCYKMTVSASHLGSTYQNNYAVTTKVASVTATEFTTLANALREIARPNQDPALAYRSWRAVQVRGADVTPVAAECRRTGGVVYEAAYTGTNSGGATPGEALPPQSALVVTLNTGKIGRRYRGRIYHFGFLETAQLNGQWTTTIFNTIGTALATFMNSYGPGGTDPSFTLGVWSERIATGCRPNPTTHHPENVDPPNLAGAFSPVQSMVVRPTVFTQRRRTLGQGR